MGNVIRSKGVVELVESCTQVPNVKQLIIIGPFENQFKMELCKIASKKNEGGWLNFVGSLDKEEVLGEMIKSSILILPSYTEGFPNVILEAMAMKCSVIATDVGAIPEMLDVKSDKPCGLCIPPQNVDSLKEAIEFLFNNPTEAEELAKYGIERVRNNYAMDKVMAQYEAVWQKASGQRINENDSVKLHDLIENKEPAQ